MLRVVLHFDSLLHNFMRPDTVLMPSTRNDCVSSHQNEKKRKEFIGFFHTNNIFIVSVFFRGLSSLE